MAKEMTLTPEQRYTAYCIMLEEAEKRPIIGCGLCKLVSRLFNVGYFSMVRVFPEIAAKEPADWERTLHWFSTDLDGWQQRCALLREVIEEMEKKLYP